MSIVSRSSRDCIHHGPSNNVILITFVFLAVQVGSLLAMLVANASYSSLVSLIFCKVTGLRKSSSTLGNP